MLDAKKIINHAAVREAFHQRRARVPKGFLEDLEMDVLVVLRRAASGDVDPEIKINGGDGEPALSPEAVARVNEARANLREGCVYLKESLLKEALREALGKNRIETAWVVYANALICSKVMNAVGRRAPRGTAPVSSAILRLFMRSPEAKTMRVQAFLAKCKDPGFLERWERRLEASKAEKQV